MSNKTQLQTNNTSLEALITRVNAAKDTAASLPEAGSTEDLNSIITELENKVATLNTALDDKASGGSFKTCTVTVNVTGDAPPNIAYVAATTVENGSLGSYHYHYTSAGGSLYTKTIENILCGATIGLHLQDSLAFPTFSYVNGGEVTDFDGKHFTFKAPLEAGVNCIITIYNKTGGGGIN